MKESYREGVAIHPGPEPCEGGRKAALEALDRGCVKKTRVASCCARDEGGPFETAL